MEDYEDYRDIEVLLHALYTYYTTFVCLSDCVTEGLFKNKQKHEAIARIGFYLIKCKIDLFFFDKIIHCHGKIENTFNKQGIELYQNIQNEYQDIKNRYSNIVKNYNYKNQPYNFDYDKFIELNFNKR